MKFTKYLTNLIIVLAGSLFALGCLVIIVFEITGKLVFVLGTFLFGIAVVGGSYLRQKFSYA